MEFPEVHDWQIEATAIALDSAVSSADYRDALTSIDNPFDGYMVFQVRVYLSKEGPTSASAYLALATNQIDYDWDWDAANTWLMEAAALEPGSSEILRVRSNLSWALGNLDQAINLREQAVALDPLRADSFLDLGYLLYVAGRYDKAQAELGKALDLNPQAAFGHFTLGLILISEGKPEQALSEIEKEPNEWGKLTSQALVYHALGREQDSNAALFELIAKHHTDSAFQIAQAYAFRGESDKSFEWLERAYQQRDAGLTMIKTDPLLKYLHQDRRYHELLKKIHPPTSCRLDLLA